MLHLKNTSVILLRPRGSCSQVVFQITTTYYNNIISNITFANVLSEMLIPPLVFTHRRCSWSQCSRPRTNIYSRRPGRRTCRRSYMERLHSRQCLHRHKHMQLLGEGLALSNILNGEGIHYCNFRIIATSAQSQGYIPFKRY